MDKLERLDNIQFKLNYNDLLSVVNEHKKTLRTKIAMLLISIVVATFALMFLINMSNFVYIPYIITCSIIVLYQFYHVLRLRMKINVGLEMLEDIENTKEQ